MLLTLEGKPLLILKNMSSFVEWFGLIQLNEICGRKPVMFVHFVVCLFAYWDG